ncbi:MULTISPECIES: MFS transporter [Pseudomonadaceae]|uniref:MFS transporter n=1 Tax=Pseudomonadaceae TaxID=135621 RepID=UPI001D192BCA|nr:MULTISPECIES: MFS transporter [Pseudomonadaceae]MCC4262477.1 MFS transporter [Halopseudomonas aestusnigri]
MINRKSPWYPLTLARFRPFWTAGAVTNLAIWMQTVGAAWIMAGLSDSAWMVSLVQTAITLPVFLCGLPGGVIADLVDRRRWLLFTQSLMLFAAFSLFALMVSGYLTPWALLGLTFLLGIGSALNMPAWMAATLTLIPRDVVPSAVALNAVSTNVARAVGPAIAGLLIAAVGQSAVFFVIALCFFGVTLFLLRWQEQQPVVTLPPETLFGGMRSGLRYIRHSRELTSSLTQVFVFTSCASSLWALLPLIAKERLSMAADGYGLLMGALGLGAVLAALNLPRLYRDFTLRKLIAGGVAFFALATAGAALLESVWAVWPVLVAAGMAWMAVNATASTIVQTCAADWVRARVASVYLLMYMGAMALGGFLWGVVAEVAGLQMSLLVSSVAMLAGLWVTRRGVFVLGSEADYRVIAQADKVMVATAVAHSDGPVSVETVYRAVPSMRADFLRIAYAVGKSRRRNGARNWRLYRDLADPDRYVERFIVESWLDYLRQRERVTQADRQIELGLSGYIDPGVVSTRRYISQSAQDTSDK